jgi:hypothetical protein
MTRKEYIVLFVTILAIPFKGLAQEIDCACCTSQHDQFDFWVGEWVVKNNKGKIIGYNTIRELENNCLISEEWSGVNKSSGRSYNYYDPKTETWSQLWISNSGNILKLEGKLEDGKMVLTGPEVSGAKGTYRNQIVWTPREDGTVIQEWIILSEGGKKKEVQFFGIYYPKEEQ